MADEITQGNAQATPTPGKPAPAAQPETTTSVFVGNGTNALAQPPTGATVETPPAQETTTFTQADVDRILKERLAQERKKYADYDTLKAKVQEAEAASLTEAEKTAKRLQELEAQNQQLATERRELSIRAAITEAAAAAGFPAEAAYRLIDKAALTMADDGKVTNAAELVKGVVEAYPGLVRNPAPRVPAANPPRSAEIASRTDGERFREYFGGGGSNFWSGGGVRVPDNQ
jgi:hypothetical protein